MARTFSRAGVLAASLAVAGVMPLTIPASAQFGSIFNSGPPRPPAGVPGGNQGGYQAPAPMGAPTQMPPEEMDNEDQPPPPPPRPAARQQPAPQPNQQLPGGVRSQPLPPPGGIQNGSAAPAQASQQPPAAGLTPAQPGQPASANQRPQVARGTPAPANVAPQPGDEVITELPSQKIQNPTAVFAGLDKITGRIISFEVALNETVQFGALQVTPRVCYTRPPTETANTDTFVEVNEVTLQGEVKRIFGGWMFAASPGLHAVEHPIYDVWLTDCKGGVQVVADTQPAPPAPTRAPPRPQQPQGNAAPAQPRQAVPQPTLQQSSPPRVAPVGPPPGFR